MSFKNIPQDVKIGRGRPDGSAALEVESTTKGFLGPRMTTVERLAIPAPVAGLEVYDTTVNTHFVFNGTVWVSASGISGPSPVVDDSLVRYDGVTGALVQDSNVILNDADEISGVTMLDVDNVNIDGNTIVASDVNGDLNLSGNGTGKVVVQSDLQVLGTTTSVDSTILDVADANITVNKAGNQASADAQDAGITVEMTDATDAQVGYDSTLTSKFKIGEIGSEQEVATTGHVQELVNKNLSTEPTLPANLSINAQSTVLASKPWPTMTEAQRDAVPAPQIGWVIYNTTQNELNIYDGADWIPYNIGVYFMIENGYERDFAVSNLGTTFETIKTITGGTLKAFDVVNNSGNTLLVRVTITGEQMIIAPGATRQIGYRGNNGDVVQIATASGTANVGNIYINFLGV